MPQADTAKDEIYLICVLTDSIWWNSFFVKFFDSWACHLIQTLSPTILVECELYNQTEFGGIIFLSETKFGM